MEISANELRIGNWVIDPLGEFMVVEQIGSSRNRNFIFARGQNGYGQNGFEPIPLTTEILEKAGFENKSNTSDYYFVLNDLFFIGGSRRRLMPSVHGESGLEPFGNEIYFVHQLQNLYFALTGQELEIYPV